MVEVFFIVRSSLDGNLERPSHHRNGDAQASNGGQSGSRRKCLLRMDCRCALLGARRRCQRQRRKSKSRRRGSPINAIDESQREAARIAGPVYQELVTVMFYGELYARGPQLVPWDAVQTPGTFTSRVSCSAEPETVDV